MTDDPSDIEARLAALELLVALLFAAQHMQTPDPAAALKRLRSVLPGQDAPGVADAALAAATDRIVGRIEALQDLLPKRLVD